MWHQLQECTVGVQYLLSPKGEQGFEKSMEMKSSEALAGTEISHKRRDFKAVSPFGCRGGRSEAKKVDRYYSTVEKWTSVHCESYQAWQLGGPRKASEPHACAANKMCRGLKTRLWLPPISRGHSSHLGWPRYGQHWGGDPPISRY